MMQEVEEPLLNNADECDDSKLEVSINQDPAPSPDPTMIPRYMSRRRVTKNLFALCISMFMFFIGFMALSNLQSTMNSEKGMGTESQAVIYITSMLSSLLLPELVVKAIGCKYTLMLSVACSLPYISANFFPSLKTLSTTAFFLGLSAGPLTASQAVYISEMARHYQRDSATEVIDIVTSTFYGYNSFATENTQIWGNLISYYALRPSMVPVLNQTNETICGVDFINYEFINGNNDTNTTNSDKPTSEQRDWLVGIFLIFGIMSILLMFFFLDPLTNDVKRGDRFNCRSSGTRLMAALNHATKVEQVLLIPISIYCGLETSFYASDFTQAYIACSWGVHHVGFVTICFGVCGALMSILVGPLVKLTNQQCVITLAALINVVMCILLFFWQPSPDAPVIYFVFAGFWGMTDAIWWSQIAALYGLMFPNDREAAFSNFFFWSFLGYFLSYSYANSFNVAVKINIMLAFLVVGMVLYLAGQAKLKYFTNRSAYVPIGDSE